MLYCTRKNVHIDRCASAWLIKRYIDPDAEFVFSDDQTPIDGAIPFDMHGVEWGHHDNRCSFETIAHIHRIDNPVIEQIGRIIHCADIAADADECLESPGLDLLVRGIRLISSRDIEAFERAYMIMDALYAAIQEDLS